MCQKAVTQDKKGKGGKKQNRACKAQLWKVNYHEGDREEQKNTIEESCLVRSGQQITIGESAQEML